MLRCFFGVLAGLLLAGQVFAQGALLSGSQFPAGEQSDTMLTISEPGRYSVIAKSISGTAIELVDKMSGPVISSGVSGSLDGRIDMNLDKGTYKIRIKGHAKAKGNVTLEARRFENLSITPVKPHQLITSELGDFQQHTFIIDVYKRETLNLEILGRNLKDARLWIPGGWLTNIRPSIKTFEPENGKPMTHIEFHHKLERGRYKLETYGGRPEAWSVDSDKSPLYLRMGIENLGTSGKKQIKVSPFGRDTFLLSENSDYIELERKEKNPSGLSMKYFRNNSSRFGYDGSAYINKKSRSPRCTIDGKRNRKKWVTVQARPGDKLTLNYFSKTESEYTLPNHGKYWISSNHAAGGGDSPEVTSILTKSDTNSPQNFSAPLLAKGIPVARKINVTGETTMFVNVAEAGAYTIEETEDSDSLNSYRIEPFMINYPKGYRMPEFKGRGAVYDLAKGLHKLTIRPGRSGILSFALRHTLQQGATKYEKVVDLKRSIAWPSVNISKNSRLYLNSGDNLPFGVSLRKLPMDLNDPLTVRIDPDQAVPVSFRIKINSVLTVESDSEFSLFMGSRAVPNNTALKRGTHEVYIKNTGRRSSVFNVKTRINYPTPDINIIAGDFSKKLEVLKSGSPVFENFEKKQSKYYILNVEKAGLYRIETSGRLETSIFVRSRPDPSLFYKKRNGIGRNALIQEYLRAGEYLVIVKTYGSSHGRLGVHLKRTELNREHLLTEGIQRAELLPADSGGVYKFNITQAGLYEINSLGLGKSFKYRLEDSEGWPLEKPGRKGSFKAELTEGTYRWYSLPLPFESRRITSVKRVHEPEIPSGKGPFEIAFNSEFNNTWRDGQPDTFNLNVKTKVGFTPRITSGMEATISKDGTEVLKFGGAKGAKADFSLEPGIYTIKVKRIEKDDYFPYEIALYTGELTPGTPRKFSTFPETRSFELTESALVDITSSGPTDVKARLFDSSGRQVAYSDDSDSNWNINISGQLPKGKYNLTLYQVGENYGPVDVSMKIRSRSIIRKKNLPFNMTESIGSNVISLPVFSSKDALIVFNTEGNGNVRLALQKEKRTVAEGEKSIFVPVRQNTAYNLLVWRTDDSTGKVKIKASEVPVTSVDLKDGPVELNPKGYYVLKDPRGRAFSLSRETPDTLFSQGFEKQLKVTNGGHLNMSEGRGWIFNGESSGIMLKPVVLKAGRTHEVLLKDRSLSFDVESDPDVPSVIEVTTMDSRLGVMITESFGKAKPKDWHRMSLSEGKTIAFIPPDGKFRAEVWQTGELLKNHTVTINVRKLPATSVSNLSSAVEILPGKAIAFPLNNEFQSIGLTISGGLAACILKEGKIISTAAALHRNSFQTIPAKGGKLFVFNTGNTKGIFKATLSKNKAASNESVFMFDGAFEKISERSGTILLNLPEQTGETESLFVRGDNVKAELYGNDGIITEGFSFNPEIISGGVLKIDHGAGFTGVYRSVPGAENLRMFGDIPAGKALRVGRGSIKLKNEPQKFRFTVPEKSLVVADLSSPGVIALKDKKGIISINASGTLVTAVNPGKHSILTRPVRGFGQSGTLTLKVVSPEKLSEGTGKTKFIAQGEFQAFTFDISDAGMVGIGLKTEADRLSAKLYGSDFQLIAEGPFTISRLEKGNYFLVVSCKGSPLIYNPVLIGSEGNLTEIPEDVKARYMER